MAPPHGHQARSALHSLAEACRRRIPPASIAPSLTVREAAWADLAADGVPEGRPGGLLPRRISASRGKGGSLPWRSPTSRRLATVDARWRRFSATEYLRRFGAAATTTSGVVELVGIRAVGIGRMAGLNGQADPGVARGFGRRHRGRQTPCPSRARQAARADRDLRRPHRCRRASRSRAPA
jgi:hypothetical protein